jgi:hypothetical protein
VSTRIRITTDTALPPRQVRRTCAGDADEFASAVVEPTAVLPR